MKTAILCLEQDPAVIRAWILQTAAFASFLNPEPHDGGQTGNRWFKGGPVCRRENQKKDQSGTGREKVVPEQGFEKRVRVCQEARRQNPRDLQGREGSSLRSVFQSSYLCSARLHQVLFVGVLGLQGTPHPAPCTRQIWVQVVLLQDGWEYAVVKISALCAPTPNRNMETESRRRRKEWLHSARQSRTAAG